MIYKICISYIMIIILKHNLIIIIIYDIQILAIFISCVIIPVLPYNTKQANTKPDEFCETSLYYCKTTNRVSLSVMVGTYDMGGVIYRIPNQT